MASNPTEPDNSLPPPAGAGPENTAPREDAAGQGPISHAQADPWENQITPATVAAYLVIAATSWYLLKEFAPLLRPLLLAVFLSYVILPVHRQVTHRLPAVTSILFLAGLSVGFLVIVGLMIAGSASQLSEEMPQLIDRAREIITDASSYYIEHLPPWAADAVHEMARGQTQSTSILQQAAASLASGVANTFSDAVLVGIYLMFLLVDAGRIPRRIQHAFPGDRPEQILAVIRNINEAMAGYLRVKVKASLVLAIPATVVLWIADVKFALMWGMLTFLLNFIPYLGSVITCGSPILLAFLQMEGFGRPTVVAVLLISIHMLSAYVVEPSMTGKAIDLSPVMILLSLAFWGLCWGLTGMLLAVPLTVMLKIVLENVDFTRPVARLMAED